MRTSAPAASVVVPWRTTSVRARLWAFLRPLWEATGWEVVEGTCPDNSPWCKGVAVADGIARASHDLIVMADADVWCELGVRQALDVVGAGDAQWAVPHQLVRRLTQDATEDVLSTGSWPTARSGDTYADRPYPGHPGGGLVVLTRDAWNTAPLDPRFAGWGQEDSSWALALRLLCGREWRGTEDLWHLWHLPQVRVSREVGSRESAALHRRYWTARNSPEPMTALLAEARRVEVPA